MSGGIVDPRDQAIIDAFNCEHCGYEAEGPWTLNSHIVHNHVIPREIAIRDGTTQPGQIVEFQEPPPAGEPVHVRDRSLIGDLNLQPCGINLVDRHGNIIFQGNEEPREGCYDPDMPGMTLDEISAWVKKEERWQSENL